MDPLSQLSCKKKSSVNAFCSIMSPQMLVAILRGILDIPLKIVLHTLKLKSSFWNQTRL